MPPPAAPERNATDIAARWVPHLAIWLMLALLLGTLWLHTFQMIEQHRAQTVASAENELVNLGRSSQEHAERTLKSADQALRVTIFEFLQHEGKVDLKELTRQGLVDSATLLQMAIIDANGMLRNSSLPYTGDIDLSDREHFKVHVATNNDELFISRPVLGRASGKWSIQLSRRIPTQDGKFGGVVVASLDPTYFTRFYGELRLAGPSLASLFGVDGEIRVRHTAAGDQFTGNISASPFFQVLAQGGQSATLTYPGIIDGIERTYHFRKLPSFPLVVAIGVETRDMVAAQAAKKTTLLRQAGLISLLLATLAIISSWYVLIRQQHARAQKQALQKLQRITEYAPGVLFQLMRHPSGRFSLPFVSAGIGDIYRLAPADAVRNASLVFRLTHPDDVSELKASMSASARMQTLWSHDFRIRFADGTVRWLSGAAMPQRQGNGTLLWNGHISDVTERMALETLLNAHRAELQATLEAIPDLMFDLDLDGYYHTCHAHRMDLLAAPMETLPGKNIAEVLPPDAAAVVTAALTEAHALGRSVGKQYALALPSGEKWFELSVARKASRPEEAPRFIVLARDVTENRHVLKALRASEVRERGNAEELNKLLDAIPTAVFVAHDEQATVITGNKLSYQWLGLSAGENLSLSAPGERLHETLEVSQNGKVLPPAAMPVQLAASGIHVSDFECDFRRADGTSRHVLANAIPLLDDSGRPRGAIAAFVDITALQQAKLALRAARTEADQANNAKSRFLAAASHDLRQPLSALSLYVRVLKHKLAPAEQEMVVSMSDCIDSLSELLRDLLDLSKLQADVVTPSPAGFSVAALLIGLESVHAPEARSKSLQLRCVSSRLTANTDPVLFRRILGNLIANAIRYTENGAVLVGCRRADGKHWIEVRDSGIGIPADKTAEIFEEFVQLGDEARNKGSGLGLAIVAKTAALLGLEIRVRSLVGRGSVFAIELPVGPSALLAPAPEAHAAEVVRSLRVALVEDNPMVRNALIDSLHDLGHQVVAAASKTALLAALDDLPPDIVLSDYRLAQGETGFDVITAVRARHGAELPAILVTGDTDPKLLRSMTERRIVMLHKPLDLETLQASLTDLTRQQPAAQPNAAPAPRQPPVAADGRS